MNTKPARHFEPVGACRPSRPILPDGADAPPRPKLAPGNTKTAPE